MVNLKDHPSVKAVLLSALLWAILLLLLFAVGSSVVQLFPISSERFVYGIAGTIAAILATWIVLKAGKNSFAEIGFIWERKTIARFLIGLLLGTLLFALIAFPLFAFTALQIDWNHQPFTVWEVVLYLAIIPLALMEEIAFRGYPFVMLNRRFGLIITQLIIAIAFALYHVVTGWSLAAAFMGPAIWSFIFGWAAARYGGIAVPTGIHVALNVLQPMVGMNSGTYASLWVLSFKEGTSESSMAFTNTIGNVLQIVILVVGIIVTLMYSRKKSSKQ